MLKNYSSTSSLSNIFNDIEKILSSHGATQITKDYENGKVIAISFTVNTVRRPLNIKLPVRIAQVKQIFDKEGRRYKEDQPYRTAWATIRDWISAQMALLDWEMVKMEEIFLPYAMNDQGKTLYEIMNKQGFYLPTGEDIGE